MSETTAVAKADGFDPSGLHNQPVAQIHNPKGTLRSYMESFEAIIANALPRHMDPGKMVSVVLTAVNTNSGILKCTFSSIMGAVIKASQLGLYPDGMLGHAYIVPFYDKKMRSTQATLIPGYKGLVALAYRSGMVKSVEARAVRKGDYFVFKFGMKKKLDFLPKEGGSRGELTHAYCMLEMNNGGYIFDVMSRAEAEEIRDKHSKQPNGFLWKDNFEAAVIKTCIRRCMKLAPLSPEISQAVTLEELAESGLPQNLDLDLPIEMQAEGDSYVAPEQAATQNNVDALKAEHTGQEAAA